MGTEQVQHLCVWHMAADRLFHLQCVVVGGGYIGMEVGSNISKHGVETTIVYPEPFLMSRLFTKEIASFYEDVYRSKGIKLMPESLATAFEGKNGKVCIWQQQAWP